MPGKIQRSDQREQEYDRYADALRSPNGTTTDMFGPGRPVSYQKDDSALLPVMTSGLLNLSEIGGRRKENVDLGRPKFRLASDLGRDMSDEMMRRAMSRRAMAGIPIDDPSGMRRMAQNNSPQMWPIDDDPGKKDLEMLCPNCADKVKFLLGNIRDGGGDPMIRDVIDELSRAEELCGGGSCMDVDSGGESSDSGEVFASIDSLLPAILRRSDGRMNKTAQKAASDLVRMLDLPDDQEDWFIARIDGGVSNPDVFRRDLRMALTSKEVL